MEHWYSLLILLSGATIVLLGFFLFAAEREIRRKRRALDEIKRERTAASDTYQSACDRCARLEAEVFDYREQLERSQSRARELESAQENRADIKPCAMNDPEQQRKLEELIGDLERELAEGKSQVAALEETHERLRETERICHELAAENHRLREEIAHWQGRFAASEENQGQATLVQQQLTALQAEHTRAIENNRQREERLPAGGEAGPLSSPVADNFYGASVLSRVIRGVAGLTSRLTDRGEPGGASLDAADSASGAGVTKEVKANKPFSWRSIILNRRLGTVFAGVLVLAIVGAVTMTNVRTEAPIPNVPVVFAPEEMSVEPRVERAEKPPVKPARLRGAFQTVRPTQVFSGPSENSALVANIGPGMRLNVVNSQNGWLEIRSKHGRPPGFVRQEAAVRVGSN